MVGSLVLPRDVRQSLAAAEALALIEIAGDRRRTEPILVDDHLLDLVLRADQALLERLSRQLLAPLDAYRNRLAERLAVTLLAWLAHAGARNAVAQALHVHPQTVRYRMTQLREAFGDVLGRSRTAYRAHRRPARRVRTRAEAPGRTGARIVSATPAAIEPHVPAWRRFLRQADGNSPIPKDNPCRGHLRHPARRRRARDQGAQGSHGGGDLLVGGRRAGALLARPRLCGRHRRAAEDAQAAGLGGSSRTPASSDWSRLRASLIPVLAFEVVRLARGSVNTSVLSALWLTVGCSAAWGATAAFRSGARGVALVVETLVCVGLGALVVAAEDRPHCTRANGAEIAYGPASWIRSSTSAPKTVLVTGGSRGIGRMIATGFVERGAKVYISSRKESELRATAEEIGATALPGDLSTEAGASALAAQIRRAGAEAARARQQRRRHLGRPAGRVSGLRRSTRSSRPTSRARSI